MPFPALKNNQEGINVFAETNFRNERKRFGIKLNDRRRHVYVIGKTGTGKSALLKNMAINDIRSGRGLGIVDPHGEFAEEILSYVPKDRINDVIYFNPADLDHPIAFNAIEQVGPEHRHLVASGLMGVFKKIWPDVWSARMEYILNNTILALLEYPDSTLLGIQRMLSDKNYRRQVVEQLSDPIVKAFWVQEFAKYTQRLETEAVAAIQNKVGQFIAAPVIRNIVGQTHSTIDSRRIMDEGKILIVNLSKGLVGEDNSKLLGGLIVTKLQLAAMSRVDIPHEEDRRDFFLYVDEFQNFATASFANILSEARKYRLSLILAHQYIMQLDETVADAVFGNVGTIMTFRIGAEDAEALEKEFEPEFAATDLVNLPNFHIYIKLMIDGVTSRAFSATTHPPYPRPAEEHREEIIRISRERYSTKREEVEARIAEWTGVFVGGLGPGGPSGPGPAAAGEARGPEAREARAK
ncbi:type IV secretion system DNA-binding domain-containing protein, partial [Candidatus Azambacteria bacterium]|nr:type IV secretion system DNA-binding domain-containing protein [Candidatus Azambacteria bacterium]